MFLTPQIIANEALMVLQANLAMGELVHRDYSKEFVKVGDTITVRKPAKFVAKNFTGETSEQDASEGSVTVKLDRFRDVTVGVTSKEMTLDIKDFSKQIVEPAMQAIAQAVDSDLLAVAVQEAGKVISSTANPTDLKDIGNLAKYFDLNKVPIQNRNLVLNPTHKYKYVFTDNLSKVSYAGDSKALREAEMGKVYTLNTFMDQNAPDTAAETAGTAKTYKVTSVKGEEKVKLTSVTEATATIKEGDAFIIDGYLYRFIESKTAVSGTIESIKIDQPIHETYNEYNKKVLLVNNTNSVAFHRNGIALVTRQLELPQGAAKAAIASADGLAIRVVYGYDQVKKKDTISFDCIYGIKELNSKMIARLNG